MWGEAKCEVCNFPLDANNFTRRCRRHRIKIECDCPAGYGQNHSIHCVLVRAAVDGPIEQEPDAVLD